MQCIIVGLVCGAYSHLEVINLFLLFCISANDFVNRRYVVVIALHYSTMPLHNSLYYFQSTVNACVPALHLTHCFV